MGLSAPLPSPWGWVFTASTRWGGGGGVVSGSCCSLKTYALSWAWNSCPTDPVSETSVYSLISVGRHRTLAVWHTPDLRQIHALVPLMLLPLPGMFFPSEPIPSNLPQHPAAFLTYQSSAGPPSSTCHLLWEAFLDASLSQAKSVAWSPFPGGTLFKRLLELLLRAPSPAWTWAKGCAQGVSVEWAG